MKKSLIYLLLLANLFQVQCQNLVPQIFDRQIINKTLVSPGNFRPVPNANDPFWHQTLPQEFRYSYIRLGHSYHAKQWEGIPDSIFSEYKTTGNQANYQKLNFGIRRQMACLVMAEILEHQGLLIEDILNGLDFFIQETWWGISAHYPTTKPDSNNQVVDLFNAETGNMLAWTIYMLHDELEVARPGICDRIKEEINRRILIPARTVDYKWKTKVDNWNTWICANWLSCVLFCEKDREKQISDIDQILRCLEVFYNGYPNDGGCDEGVHYWDRAAASLYESIRLITIATNGHFSFADDSKFKAMGSFVYKTYIRKNAYVNFADAFSNTNVNINILYPYGQYIGDSIMTNFAAMLAEEADYKHNPVKSFFNSGNYPSLSRELLFLSDYTIFDKCKPAAPLLRDIVFPELQVFMARSYYNSNDGIYVAAKGGHNDERHNHNDIGSFIAYCDSEPLLIDIGISVYNSKTFSNKRYELTNCRSAYHNVPLINGFEQHEGKEYHAKDVQYSCNNNSVLFALNLEEAYPLDAQVEKWRRTIRFVRGKHIEIEENFHLKKYVNPTDITLICYGEPQLVESGKIALKADNKEHFVLYNSKQVEPLIERIQFDDPIVLETWSKWPLYRIRLRVCNRQIKGKIKYFIL